MLNNNSVCKCIKRSHLQEAFLLPVCPHSVFSLRRLFYKHVRYTYPIMHLSLSLESLCKCMFLCSIFFSLHNESGGTVGVMFTLLSSFCCVYMYSVHFCFFKSIYFFFVCLSPSPRLDKSSFGSFPQRYIA